MEISGKKICNICMYKQCRTADGVCNQCNIPICKWCFWSHIVTEEFGDHILLVEQYDTEFNARENAIVFKKHINRKDVLDADDVHVDDIYKRALPERDRKPTNLKELESTRFHRSSPERSKLEVKTYHNELYEKGIAGVKRQLHKELEERTAVKQNSSVNGNSGTRVLSFFKTSFRGLGHNHDDRESRSDELQYEGNTGHCPDSSKYGMESYEKEFYKNGIAGVKKQLHKDLRKWTTIGLNIAVIGDSGTGKSSFINSIRGLTAEDPLAAKVGCTETTTKVKDYPHPDNKSLIIWDLPGAGTMKFPIKEYLKTFDLNKYDFFILLSRGRFTEIVSKLAAEIQKLEKKCFLIITHIDMDIQHDKHDHPSSHDEQKLSEEIRTESEKMLMNNGVRVPKVFLISNHARDKYDFGKLHDALLASCDSFKKDAMALSLTKLTQNVIIEKKKILEKRIPVVALSIVNSDTPQEQRTNFIEEIKFYQKQFSIDDVSLHECRDILDLSDEKIEEYKVVFDEMPGGKKTTMTTPTARRAAAAFLDRFVDVFRFSKENRLLYIYSEHALSSNLEILYKKASMLYDINTATGMICTILR